MSPAWRRSATVSGGICRSCSVRAARSVSAGIRSAARRSKLSLTARGSLVEGVGISARAGSTGAPRPIALDCVRMGRVHAHVDALVPRALERIAHAQLHAPDAVDLEVHDLSVLQRSE